VEIFDAIKTRRSIRRYTDDPVDDGRIEAILEAGRWAPSWSNTQCWRFLVVRDPAIRDKMTEALLPFHRPEGIVPNRAAEMFRTAPVVIAVCAQTGQTGGPPGKPGGAGGEFITDKGDWFMFDTALAVENMSLAAHALGLGSVVIGTFDAPRLEKILEIPPGYRVVVVMPVGIPAGEGRVPPRKELSEITFRDKWGNSR
jgi:nitroreductase